MSESKLCNTCEKPKTKFFSEVELERGHFKRICSDCYDNKFKERDRILDEVYDMDVHVPKHKDDIDG